MAIEYKALFNSKALKNLIFGLIYFTKIYPNVVGIPKVTDRSRGPRSEKSNADDY
jgi:hypothetical protein